MAVYIGKNKVEVKGGFIGKQSAELQDKTVTPTEEKQIVTPDSAYDGLNKVTVEAIDSKYVGSNVPKISGQAIVPSTTNITIAADQYLTGSLVIKGDPNLLNRNIRKGVSIFGRPGTYEGINTSDADAAAENIEYGKTAYVNGEKITGNIPTISDFSASAGVVTSDNGLLRMQKTISKMITGQTIELTSRLNNFGNATAADVVADKTFTSADGYKITGTASSSGSNNGYNCESYFISDVNNLNVQMTNTNNVRAYGYAVNGYQKYMFSGDRYTNVAYGISTVYTKLSLSIVNGYVEGLPDLSAGSLLITTGGQ